MFRLVKMQGKWWGLEFKETEDDAENIDILVGQGDVVILVGDLEDFKQSDIYDDDEIEIVE